MAEENDRKEKSPPPPSKEFEDAFTSLGSGVIKCTFCDRVHFVADPTGFDWDKGEHEGLVRSSEKTLINMLVIQKPLLAGVI